MKVFINTAFFPLDYEYRWYLIDKSNCLHKDLSASFPEQILELMNTNYKSICLYHDDGEWILGLGALESSERKRIDCAGRRIRNSVILISESHEDTRLLLGLSIAALKDWSSVALAFDNAFEEKRENPPIMVVHASKLAALQKYSLSAHESNLAEPELNGFTYPDRQDWIRKIECDLCKTDLAKISGPVLVFQKHESDDYYREKKIWRGIGGLIKEPFSYPLTETKNVAQLQNTKYMILLAFIGLLAFVTVYFIWSRLTHKIVAPGKKKIPFASIYFRKTEERIEPKFDLKSILETFNFRSHFYTYESLKKSP